MKNEITKVAPDGMSLKGRFTKEDYDNGSEQADEMEIEMEHKLDNYLTWYYEERD